MTALLVLGRVLLSLLVPAYGGGQAGAAPTLVAPVTVTVDQDRHSTVIGNRFTLRSRVTNPGAAPTGPLLAHLNVASVTNDVYVDPEDWSSERTLEVPPLQPGAGTTLSWDLQAVNAGSFAVYVVVLPGGGASAGAGAGAGALVVSPAMHLDVAGRRTLNAEGALPVVLGVPIVLGVLAVGARRRVRRTG